MAINADGYFGCLDSYLNTTHYTVPFGAGSVVLKEKVFDLEGEKTQHIELKYDGKILAFKLDTEKNGKKPPLFHFLDDTAKPWSKRCDFVIFNLRGSKIFVYCFEFKSNGISADSIIAQITATKAWCLSLCNTIKNYTGHSRQIYLSKFVLTTNQNPAAYLDPTGKYLKADNTIRHYNYKEIDGMNLKDLENSAVETIK
jgi:hypothetical protein